MGLQIRGFFYRLGFIKTYKPIGPVLISIGNIAVGGTGKTPSTLMLAQAFYPHTKIAILSRGYRSVAEKQNEPMCLSKGDGPLHSALYCGDEPRLLVENLPKAIAFVGKNRSRAAQLATEAGAKLILIDDGMQHHKLARDFEVVVMDGRDPFGQGHLLPRGSLRDEPKTLVKADLIILNHIDTPQQYQDAQKQISKYSSAPTVGTKLKVVRIVGFEGKSMETIAGKKVGLFCSIARPDYFEETVKNLGAEIIHRYIIPDHKFFETDEMRKFADECRAKGADLLICTEKDKVKLLGNLSGSLPVAWVQIRLSIVQDEENWDTFITKVHALLEL
jgi:tetraacyldisaccharide 4'-kinase